MWKKKKPVWEVLPKVERTQEDVDALNKEEMQRREDEYMIKMIELQNKNLTLKPNLPKTIYNKIKFFIKDVISLFSFTEWYFSRLKSAIRWERNIDYELIYTDIEWYLINIVHQVCIISEKDTEMLRVTRAILSPREVIDCSDEEFDNLHVEKMKLKKRFYELLPDLSYNIY